MGNKVQSQDYGNIAASFKILKALIGHDPYDVLRFWTITESS